MYMKIRAIVYGKNTMEGFKKAENVFKKLCEENVFDHYEIKTNNTVSAFCKTGQKLINEGMDFTKKEFERNMNKIRKAVNSKTDSEILNDKDVRCSLLLAGQYKGHTIWLYDNECEGILSEDDLKNVLNKYECLYKNKKNPLEDQKIWVVTANVHY